MLLRACALTLCLPALASTPVPGRTAGPKDYARFVNPFIGTGGHGHTFPGPSMPFGMIQPGPDTRLTGWDGCSGYHDSDDVIYGFSQTHLSGTGVSDYGDVLLLPFTGPVKWKSGYQVKGEDPDSFDSSGYGSHFRKATEKAEPGYYAVHLGDYGVQAEITSTTRVAMYRWTFERGDAQVLLDLDHRDQVLESSLHVVDDRTIEGFRRSRAWAVDQPLYFRLRFDHPFHAQMGDNPRRKLALRFDLKPGGALLAKIAVAATDALGARKNLGELEGWDFDATRRAARAAWNRELSKIEVEGGGEAQTRIFYTALYHAFLQPNTFQDVDGRYLGRDLKVHQAKPGETRYTVFSLWDTFRAAHPLYTLVQPQRDQDFIRTFLGQYQEAGRLPVWELWGNETDCMIGYHAVPVIVDAWMKGLRGFDGRLALKAMVASADADRPELRVYRDLGYLPADQASESVSKTLEYAYDDWCIGAMAEEMGHLETEDRFERRAQGWKNLFDGIWMHPRLNGGFAEPFDPSEVTFHYTEANAWQYSFFVPQDLDGLMKRQGGASSMEHHLDDLFSAESRTKGREQADITGLVGQYAHGNEPSHHMAYLYDYAGAPWKTQAMARRLMDTMYRDDPNGLIGNEDCGQMSAWYVMSALGIYEVCPGRPDYAIGSPRFPKATLHLDHGRTFTIRARGVDRGPFIQSARLDGNVFRACHITHAELLRGGVLDFELGSAKSSWGSAEGERPRSAMTAKPIIPAPVIEGPETFTWVQGPGNSGSGDNIRSMKTLENNGTLLYSTDGREPSQYAPRHIILDREATTVNLRAVEGEDHSSLVTATFHRLDPARHLTLKSAPHPQYLAGGDQALIDGLRGGPDFRLGHWQGFYGKDVEAELDLGSVKELHRLALGCLQDQNSWIFMPLSVSFEVSEDGKAWTGAGIAPNPVKPEEEGTKIHDFEVRLASPLRGRFVRVHTWSASRDCPPWHKGAGKPFFIFCDELIVE